MGTIEEVPIADLDLEDQTYRSSLDRDIGSLLSSMRKLGLLVPLKVQKKGDGLRVVSGFLRAEAAVQLSMKKVMVQVVNPGDPLQTLLCSLHENLFTRGFSWIERTWVLEKALGEFQASQKWATSELLPAMGLEPADRILTQHMLATSIPFDLRRKLALHGCSLANATRIASMELEDQRALSELLSCVHMSENILRQCLDLLREVELRDGLKARDILSSPELKGALEQRKGDRVQKGEAVRAHLLRLRMPILSHLRDRFERAKKGLSLPRKISLQTDSFFETKGVTVTFHAKNPNEFIEIAEKLKQASSKAEAIRELFSVFGES